MESQLESTEALHVGAQFEFPKPLGVTPEHRSNSETSYIPALTPMGSLALCEIEWCETREMSAGIDFKSRFLIGVFLFMFKGVVTRRGCPAQVRWS